MLKISFTCLLVICVSLAFGSERAGDYRNIRALNPIIARILEELTPSTSIFLVQSTFEDDPNSLFERPVGSDYAVQMKIQECFVGPACEIEDNFSLELEFPISNVLLTDEKSVLEHYRERLAGGENSQLSRGLPSTDRLRGVTGSLRYINYSNSFKVKNGERYLVVMADPEISIGSLFSPGSVIYENEERDRRLRVLRRLSAVRSLAEFLEESDVRREIEPCDGGAEIVCLIYLDRRDEIRGLLGNGRELSVFDGFYKSPLDRALEFGSESVTGLLLSAGAPSVYVATSEELLRALVLRDFVALARMELGKRERVSLDAVDLFGLTPLGLALALDFQEMIELLLERGADPRKALFLNDGGLGYLMPTVKNPGRFWRLTKSAPNLLDNQNEFQAIMFFMLREGEVEDVIRLAREFQGLFEDFEINDTALNDLQSSQEAADFLIAEGKVIRKAS